MDKNFYYTSLSDTLKQVNHACGLLSLAGTVNGDDSFVLGHSNLRIDCCDHIRVLDNSEVRALTKLCSRNTFSRFIEQNNLFRTEVSKVVSTLNSWPADALRERALIFASNLVKLKIQLGAINAEANYFANEIGTKIVSQLLDGTVSDVRRSFSKRTSFKAKQDEETTVITKEMVANMFMELEKELNSDEHKDVV